MNKIVLGGLTGGVLVPMVAITLFTSVIVPRLSTSQISIAYCLPTTSGTVTSDKQTPLATPNALGAGAGKLPCHGLHRKHSDSSGCFGHCRPFARGSRCQLGCPDAVKGPGVLGSALSCWIRLLD